MLTCPSGFAEPTWDTSPNPDIRRTYPASRRTRPTGAARLYSPNSSRHLLNQSRRCCLSLSPHPSFTGRTCPSGIAEPTRTSPNPPPRISELISQELPKCTRRRRRLFRRPSSLLSHLRRLCPGLSHLHQALQGLCFPLKTDSFFYELLMFESRFCRIACFGVVRFRNFKL